MQKVKALISPETVFLDVSVSSKKQLFEFVAEQVASHYQFSRDAVFTGLTTRERLGSTALGFGTAIPHARTKGVSEPVGVFVRLQTPIPFDAPDSQPVSLIFVLLVPESANQVHLEILSELASILSCPSSRQQLLSCKTAKEFCASLNGETRSGD